MSTIRSIPAFILAIVTTTAVAHDGMHGPGAEFDADEDGSISPAEYTAYLKATKQDASAAAAMFAKVDTDKNGKLSAAEFIVGMSRAPAKKEAI